MSETIKQIQKNILRGDMAFKRSTLETYNSALDSYLEAAFHIAKKKWKIPIHQKIRSVLTADINNDGKDEVLVGTEGHLLFAYDSDCSKNHKTPQHFWEKPFYTGGWVNGIAVADIDGDGNNEIIVASDKIYILDEHGCQKGEYFSDVPISSLQIYSDEDGKEMIVVGDNYGTIKCYDYDFIELWPFPFKKSNHAIIDLSIGDFDGDGRIEVAAASEDKFVYIIDDMGEEKDKIDVRHWIVNMSDCRMKNSKLRLFIGKFTGDTLVYKHKQTNQIVSLKQSGILDLKVEYIFDDEDYPQFIVGSSDRCLSIFDYSGEPIWIFESGLGQRALSIKKIGNGKLDLFIGTESGDVFCYSLNLVKELVQKIKLAYKSLKVTDMLDLELAPKKLEILRNYIEYNPINKDASLEKAQLFKDCDFNKAIVAGMEVWFNNCSFIWSFQTQGRVYDLAPYYLEEDQGLLVGSDDGILYCLDQNGTQKWIFNSCNDLRGISQGIRGVYCDTNKGDIYTVSADKSLYSLSSDGEPQWNFGHEDWILFTYSGYFSETKSKSIFVGTEDGYVLAFDESGLLIWKNYIGKRIRALSFCDNYKGHSYVLAGCDDNKVYIIDYKGNIFNEFSTPHYVLVIQVSDIYGDGNFEILTGNEDGLLHVYDFEGHLLWRFETESWVAALDVYKNKNGETEIVIGSQDNNIYVLNKYGALLWQYESNARVRTVSADSKSNRVSFGSYDKKVYTLEQVNRDKSIEFLYQLYVDNVKISGDKEDERIQKMLNSPISSRHKRAFVYLFTKDPDLLIKGLSDHADIVIAAIGCNMVENFLTQNLLKDVLINLLVSSNRKVKAIVFCKLIQLKKEDKVKKHMVANIIRSTIEKTSNTSSKIDVFRYWLTISTNCDEILRMAKYLIPNNEENVDQYLVDELNRTAIVALKANTDDSGDGGMIDTIEKIVSLIEQRYPKTAIELKVAFL